MTPSPPFATGLYAILDLATLGARDPLRAARALLDGGAVALQLRVKDQKGASDPPALLELASKLRRLARSRDVPFIVNDDLELALASEADGLHLGQDDLSPEAARARLGPAQRIGLSTHDLAQARAALSRPVDYLGFGPVFPTRTKTHPDPVQGVAHLAEACREVPLAVVAIGGLTVATARDVARAGAHAVASIGAILDAEDIQAEARRFTEAFRLGSRDLCSP